MMGLILKDLLNLRKELKIYVLFIAVYVVITFVSEDVNILMAVISLMCVMMPVTAIGYDEKVNWDKYSLTMPISRKDIVLSRYMLGLGLATVGLIITSILSIIDKGLFKSYLNLPIVFWAISIIMLSVIIPVIIKFGAEKGRFIMIAIMFIPSILIMLFGETISIDQFSELKQIVSDNSLIISLLGAVISLTISFAISLKIFENKEL